MPVAHVATDKAVSAPRLSSCHASFPLICSCSLSGDAQPGQDFEKLPGSVTIPGDQHFALVRVQPLATAQDNRTVLLNLKPGQTSVHPDCPSASLVVIRN